MNAPLLYLASGSPRRREILANLGFRIERLAADIDETPYPQEDASSYALRMAQQKNQAALSRWQAKHPNPPDAPILTADTTVALNGMSLGKPDNARHAKLMLQQLSDGTHQVLSSVCVYYQGRSNSILQSSTVTFKPLSEQEIDAYIASGEPLDKAGAYGIQGLGGVFVSSLSGSFTGVMGLPVYETCQLLAELGSPVPPFAR